MPVTDVTTDAENLTLTITAQFAAPVERIWEIYADPRQLERIWGPPECPATFVDHELVPGARSTYYMDVPEQGRHCGYWDIVEVDPPHRFVVRDGFAHQDFTPNDEMPVGEMDCTFTAHEGGTRAVFISRNSTRESFQMVLDMGVVEGSTSAINQIDALVA